MNRKAALRCWESQSGYFVVWEIMRDIPDIDAHASTSPVLPYLM